jgi:hypothetical protein
LKHDAARNEFAKYDLTRTNNERSVKRLSETAGDDLSVTRDHVLVLQNAGPQARRQRLAPASCMWRRKRELRLEASEEEWARRRDAFAPRPPRLARGYGALFARAIGQADEGCDFDFLERGEALPEPEIH